MNNETPEQAAKRLYPTIGWGHPDDLEQKCKQEGFIAGASWREQQAASGFREWEDEHGFFIKVKDFTVDLHLGAPQKYKYIKDEERNYTLKKCWQAAQLSSAKLLAEKDAEIERLKAVILEMSEGLGFYANQSNWRDIVAEEAINDKHGLAEGCFDTIIYEDCELDVGGKRAREALLKHKELLDQINSEISEVRSDTRTRA